MLTKQMYDRQFYKLAGITCQLVNYRRNSSFDNWRWKLDPYRTEEEYLAPGEEEKSIIITDAAGSMNMTGRGILIAEESAGFYQHRLYDTGNGHFLWQFEDAKSSDVMLAFEMSLNERKITLLCDNTETGGTLALEYLGRVLVPLLLEQGLLTFHGVLMEYHGQGIILSAPSGTGKTTHARLWRDYKNALIINGDRTSVKEEQGVWNGYGLPWSGSSGEQINRKVPIKAFVNLERSEENAVVLVKGMPAFEAMLTHLQVPAWHRELSEKAINQVLSLTEDIPVIRLACRPDRDSVDVLENLLQTID